MIFDDEIEKSLAQLKDFQKATVEYAFKKYQEGQKRYLIADEVGLGKTIVARGIIAKLYQKYYKSHKDFVVVYICSNRALAKQNIRKLSFADDSDNIIDFREDNDRLSDLAFEDLNTQPNKYNFKIKAFTPATSFDNKTRAGKQKERILLYRLLVDELSERRVSLLWFLRGGNRIKKDNWRSRIKETKTKTYQKAYPIRVGLKEKFIKRIKAKLETTSKVYKYLEEGEQSLYDILERVLIPRKRHSSFTKGEYPYDSYNIPLIAELRYFLNEVCADYLHADLFVLDEFQRFSTLIQQDENETDPGSEIARKIFQKKQSKILLLSATPFKAYTNHVNEFEGEDHYIEFRKVLRFLLNQNDDIFWKNLDISNQNFFKALHQINKVDLDRENIYKLKSKIEEVYRNAISRTERTLVEETNIFSKDILTKLPVTKEDISDFISFDSIIQEVNKTEGKSLPIPIEYVKSAPFPLSFLQDYEYMKVIETEIKTNKQLKTFIKKAHKAFVPQNRIASYKSLLPEDQNSAVPNPKLRLLYDETIRNGGWELLWIPPTIEYYLPPKSSPFAKARNFSKTLIFSAWKMVPRMVSALVSYEAERYSIGKLLKNKENIDLEYFKSPRYPRPRLVFKKGLKNMNNFLLTYPSIFLANLYHPKNNLIENKTLSQIKKQLKVDIKSRLLELNIFEIQTEEQRTDNQRWNWFALFLLDRNEKNNKALQNWITEQSVSNSSLESEEEKAENDDGGKQEHYNEMLRCLKDGMYIPKLNPLNKNTLEQICIFLAELAIGSPAITTLRALNQLYFNSEESNLQCAYDTGMAFTTLFNKPESIAIIDLKMEADDSYYSNVIKYCIEGNIQAMLDEFLFQLKESGNATSNIEATNQLSSILAVGTSGQDIKTQGSLIKGDKNITIRTHYALPFGTGNASDLKVGNRQIKVREAFNSPFRPFVLTSTSIGQEGLDFHFYCDKLIHWNLPSNPIDLEQREGRIKRFKSLAVRRAIIAKYKDELKTVENIWEQIYQIAINNKNSETCDLVPFWHVDESSAIKSIIPLYPYSKDIGKLEYIKNVLANYRLTFGQPRQEELITLLSKVNLKNEELKELTINLSPISYY